MGDADNEVIQVVELEDWIGELTEISDESLECMMMFVTYLSSCADKISKKVESFRRCFTALNLLVIPLAIAIFLSYGTNDPKSDGLETLVSMLVFFSGAIGLPYYVYSAWEYYCQDDKVKGEKNGRVPEDDQEMVAARATPGEAFANFSTAESPTEILNDFARMLNNRMVNRRRLATEVEQRTVNWVNESLPSVALDSTHSSTAATSENKDSPEAKANRNSESDLYEFYDLIIRKKKGSSDLEVEIERGDEKSETIILTGSHLQEEKNKQHNPFGDLLEL